MRIQGSLPLNPQHFGAVKPALSFNTATSFLTNTNWQNYGGETTMSYFSQIGALTVQQFVSAAVGIAVAIAVARGFARRNSPTIGNFWVDITRCMLYILLPVAFLAGIIVVGQGAVQTLAGPVTIHNSLNGVTQTIARGPAGFMGPIMQLGTNGGGFFNVDLAHPLENPTGSNQSALHLAHPVHPVRAHLHLRQDGGQYSPGRRSAVGHGDHLRGVGRLHQLRRAPGQPGGRHSRPNDAHTQRDPDLER